MINKWNKTVKPDDIVFHLGDFGDYNLRKHLNGKIILICGNYEDKLTDKELLAYGFNEVHRGSYSIKYKLIVSLKTATCYEINRCRIYTRFERVTSVYNVADSKLFHETNVR